MTEQEFRDLKPGDVFEWAYGEFRSGCRTVVESVDSKNCILFEIENGYKRIPVHVSEANLMNLISKATPDADRIEQLTEQLGDANDALDKASAELGDANDRIAALEARLSEAVGYLRPLVEEFEKDRSDGEWRDDHWWMPDVTYGHMRAARAFLASLGAGENKEGGDYMAKLADALTPPCSVCGSKNKASIICASEPGDAGHPIPVCAKCLVDHWRKREDAPSCACGGACGPASAEETPDATETANGVPGGAEAEGEFVVSLNVDGRWAVHRLGEPVCYHFGTYAGRERAEQHARYLNERRGDEDLGDANDRVKAEITGGAGSRAPAGSDGQTELSGTVDGDQAIILDWDYGIDQLAIGRNPHTGAVAIYCESNTDRMPNGTHDLTREQMGLVRRLCDEALGESKSGAPAGDDGPVAWLGNVGLHVMVPDGYRVEQDGDTIYAVPNEARRERDEAIRERDDARRDALDLGEEREADERAEATRIDAARILEAVAHGAQIAEISRRAELPRCLELMCLKRMAVGAVEHAGDDWRNLDFDRNIIEEGADIVGYTVLKIDAGKAVLDERTLRGIRSIVDGLWFLGVL